MINQIIHLLHEGVVVKWDERGLCFSTLDEKLLKAEAPTKSEAGKKPEKEKCNIAPTIVLYKPKAKNILLKYQQAGFLDEAYQPLHLSREKTAILAYTIAKELRINNMWKIFGEFWNIKSLSTYYYIGINKSYNADFIKDVERV